jgi:hypothetical protein
LRRQKYYKILAFDKKVLIFNVDCDGREMPYDCTAPQTREKARYYTAVRTTKDDEDSPQSEAFSLIIT